MITIGDYKKIIEEGTGYYKAISSVLMPCPICGNDDLSVVGSVTRKLIVPAENDDGIEEQTWRIRQLKCSKCGSYHRELPADLFIPHKRYASEVIQQVIEQENHKYTWFNSSTISRWRAWFIVNLNAILSAIKSRQGRYPLPNDHPIESKEELLAKKNWLAWIVFTLTNFGCFPHVHLE
jgi:hypothetical protein